MEEIAKGLYRLSSPQQPAFLVTGHHKVVQVDAGPAFMGPTYLEDIRKLLGEGIGPDLLLLTHSHFDHIGGAPYLLRHYPEMILGASEQLSRFLSLDRAEKIVKMLNQGLVKKYRKENDFLPRDFDYSNLKVDEILKDGDTIDLGGGGSIEVIATPGHTRDSLSFFLHHAGVVFTGEAVGIIPGDDFWVAPQFLSSYEDYISSIERIQEKNPEVIVLGHHCVVRAEEAKQFFDASVSDCVEFRKMIQTYLKEAGMDEEKVIQRIKEEEYLTVRKGKQPEEAFLLNLKAQVNLIAKGLRKDRSGSRV